eukprot:4734258-Karenia_brevis.AAC.1
MTNQPKRRKVQTDSDWGQNIKDRKSTSGGVWFMGEHCIKIWSASQAAYALSSAEAELYAMVKGLGTDSSAAESFVYRRGLGKMRHLEIRDLSLHKEVSDGLLEISKIPGKDNPADLLTKILGIKEIVHRLENVYVLGASVERAK